MPTVTIPAPRRRRRAQTPLTEPFPSAPAQSVDRILTQYQDVAADAFGDARRLAVWLHSEGHAADTLARDVALAVARMAGLAWQAAELESEAGA